MAENLAERLDHSLEFAEQRIDDDAGLQARIANDDNIFSPTESAVDFEPFIYFKIVTQTNIGKHFTAQINVAALTFLRAIGSVQLDALHHHVERNYECRLRHLHQESVDDGQRQRQPDAHGAANPGFAVDTDGAAQRFDVLSHHIHADTAAGQVGDLLGGGESRSKNQLVDLPIAERMIGRNDAFLDRLAENSFFVEAAAVVGHFDNDAARIVIGIQLDGALPRLAALLADVCRLDTVIHRIAEQVHQRIANSFHHGFIELGFGAADLQRNVLAELLADIAHHTLKPREGFANLHHAQRQRRIAHFLDQLFHVFAGFEQFSYAGVLGQQIHAGTADHQLADQGDQMVELVGID